MYLRKSVIFESGTSVNVCAEVFGSTGSVGTGHFVLYSRKSVTLDFLNPKSQFGDCQKVRYPKNPLLPKIFVLSNIRNCPVNPVPCVCIFRATRDRKSTVERLRESQRGKKEREKERKRGKRGRNRELRL